MRLCQMARAGFYVVFPFPRIGITFFSLLEWGPAGDPVPAQGMYTQNEYVFSPF